jgi:hypothetical protein
VISRCTPDHPEHEGHPITGECRITCLGVDKATVRALSHTEVPGKDRKATTVGDAVILAEEGLLDSIRGIGPTRRATLIRALVNAGKKGGRQ